MYITKLVYAEFDDFKPESLEFLKNYSIITETDYGTVEILSEKVQESKNNKRILDTLKRTLGNEIVEALLNNTIDLVMVV